MTRVAFQHVVRTRDGERITVAFGADSDRIRISGGMLAPEDVDELARALRSAQRVIRRNQQVATL